LPGRPAAAKLGRVGAVATGDTDPGDARQRILEAAVRRIAQEGIDGVRIARIAMDARVSAALVHYHFASRDALLAEAIDYSYEKAGDTRTIDPATVEGAPARLAAMIEQCLPLPGPQRDDWLLWVELWLRAARSPELRPTAARLYERMHEWFAGEITAGIEAGELTPADPGRTADLIVALLDGFGVRALAGDPALDLATARRRVWEALAAEVGLDAHASTASSSSAAGDAGPSSSPTSSTRT
jgi:AcrR family transcriptional regulator